jgi:hypothetical protein
MKRSTFLKILAGGTLFGFGSFKLLTGSFEQATVNLVRKELSFLRLDDDGLQKFASDFGKTMTQRSYRYRIKGYSFLGIGAGRSGKVNHIVTTYLLSSDFFQSGMDESRLVKYVSLYSPYLRPCAHPFSHAQYT